MIRRFAVSTGVVAATTLALVLAACERKQEAATPATTAQPAPVAASPATPLPGPVEDVPPPEGVLRAYVWECDDGRTLKVRNLYRENAVAIALHEGARRLPQVASASGSKYEDEAYAFWSKGSEATFEHKGAAKATCRELRARSLVEDARVRGVLYRGNGNEPGWTVEVGPGSRLAWETNYGQEKHTYANAVAGGDAKAGYVYIASDDGGPIKVTVQAQACRDDMAGQAFDHRVTVEAGGRTHRGCGRRLQ